MRGICAKPQLDLNRSYGSNFVGRGSTDTLSGVSIRWGLNILDFYCPEAKLCVELDGDQHGTWKAQAHDAARSNYLRSKGIRVVRFGNHELKENMEAIVETIRRSLEALSKDSSP